METPCKADQGLCSDPRRQSYFERRYTLALAYLFQFYKDPTRAMQHVSLRNTAVSSARLGLA